MQWPLNREPRACVRFALRTGCLLLFWYVSSYVLMMDWRRTAYISNSSSWYASCYRMAPEEDISSQFTIIAPVECWANRLFLPLDWLVKNLHVDRLPSVANLGRKYPAERI